MRRVIVALLIVGVALVGVLGLIQVARGQGQGPPAGSAVVQREIEGENVRQVLAPSGVEEPSISLVDAITPYCFQPNPGLDECVINWASIHVEGTPASMDVMTATIDGLGVVARYHGFFQETMDVSHAMNGRGFQVPCGPPGAGGRAQLGHGYDWTIRAEDTGGQASSSSGVIYCPPFNP
jgi:hypothetical protein